MATSWTSYFERISRFLDAAQYQYGVADRNFCEYVLERLELCIATCTSMCEHMGNSRAALVLVTAQDRAQDNDNPSDNQTIQEYYTNIFGLVNCLKVIHSKWME